jgi:exopolysaccharide biosynthesis polyprenyl glycosylphosphotransferase
MNRGIYRRISKISMAILDILMIHLGFLLAFNIRFDGQWPQDNIDSYISIVPWLSVGALIIFYLFDFYSNWSRKSFHKFAFSIIMALGLFTLLTMAISFWYRGFAFPRSVIFLGGLFFFVFILGGRLIAWYLQKCLNGKRKVLIVGNKLEDGLFVAEKFLEHVQGWFEVVGFVSVDDKKNMKQKMSYIDVILVSPSLSKEEKAEVMSYSFRFGKEVLIVPELYELFIMDAEIQQIDDMPVMSIMPPKLSTFEYVLKRSLDLVVSILMLITVSPIMIILSIVIPLTSSGSTMYAQERLGLNGKRYVVYKFRSMVNDAENKTGPILATEHDPRVTPIGRIIRSTRLDEFPQLFNVLKGDMSLVGPRPEREFFIEQFKETIPDYMYRMSVKPGITGLAQVMAKYSTTVEDKLRYDLMYIRNYSILLDLKILFQTILVVLQKDKSSGLKSRDKKREEILKKMILSHQVEVAAGQERK